ncbi:MAG: integrase, partial [Actinomycetota bacterium]|nr:integrase [Actinomycetota bacterium]
ATGASTRELIARMGHASPDAAIRYQHATEDRDRAIADALSRRAATHRSGTNVARRPVETPEPAAHDSGPTL